VANKKFSELTIKAVPTAGDYLPILDTATNSTKRIPFSALPIATGPAGPAGPPGGGVGLAGVNTPQAVAYAATITPALASGDIVKVGALTGPLAVAAPTGYAAGRATLTLILTQDATGGRALTFDPVYLGVPTLATTPNLTTVLMFVSDGTSWFLRSLTTITGASAGGGGVVAATTYYGTLPHEGADDSAYYAALVAAGAKSYPLSVQWALTEPTKGSYNFSAVVTKRDALRAAGLDVILGLHSQYYPDWVTSDSQTATGAQYKNQNGTLSTDNDASANVVWNQGIRDRQALWIAAAASALGTTGWQAIRPPALVYNEWSYPHEKDGNDYWAYDALAQATTAVAGRVPASRIPFCPVPGWKPGTGTAAQAGQFADWYIDALVDTMRWSCETVQASFPGVLMTMLNPSFGTRGTQYADAKTGLLVPGKQTGEIRAGCVFERSIPAFCANPGAGVSKALIVGGSSWSDCLYSNQLAAYDAERDPYSTLCALFAAGGVTKFYAETTGGASQQIIVRNYERFRRHRPYITLMAFTDQYTGPSNSQLLANLQDAIALDKQYASVVVDAAILYHAINVHAAQRKADQWGVKLLIGEHGVANDGTWNTLFDKTYGQFDDHADHVTAWASFLDQGNPLAIYKAGTAGFKTDTATTLATVVEAHPDTTARRRGVNLSGADGGFDRNSVAANSMSTFNPGVRGTDYAYPAATDIAYLAGRGVKFVRLPFIAERLFTDITGATFRTGEQAAIAAVLDACATNGIQVILDMHNYGRFRTAPDAATAVTINVLGAGWTAAQHNAMWQAISTWLAGGPAARNAAVWGYSHNEPYNLGSTTGAFTGTIRYDWNDGTVQGWTGDGGTFTNVASKGRLGGTVTAAGFNLIRKDDAGVKRGGALTGNVLRFKATLNPAGTMTSGLTGWHIKATWQSLPSYSFQDPSSITYARTDTGAALSELLSGVEVLVTCDFTGNPITNPNAFALQLDNGNATVGAAAVDVDDLAQGAVTGGGSIHETVFASWASAIAGFDPNRKVLVPLAEYSSLSGFPGNHPAATPFFTVTANTLVEAHSYYDLYANGPNYSGTYGGATSYLTTRDVAGGYQ